MKPKIKNLDEVVFESRNQSYGAYFLRKTYNKNVTDALFIAILLFLAAVSIPLLGNHKKLPGKIKIISYITMDSNLVTPYKTEPEELKPQKSKDVEQVPHVGAIQITDDQGVGTEDFPELTGDATDPELPSGGDSIVIIDETPIASPVVPIVPEQPIGYADIMPSFKGGEAAMFKWLEENIHYPEMAREEHISGTVSVTFVVEKDGNISNISLLHDIGGNCGNEAIRVVKAMPRWNEGRQQNIPVRVQFVLPIKFTLE